MCVCRTTCSSASASRVDQTESALIVRSCTIAGIKCDLSLLIRGLGLRPLLMSCDLHPHVLHPALRKARPLRPIGCRANLALCVPSDVEQTSPSASHLMSSKPRHLHPIGCRANLVICILSDVEQTSPSAPDALDAAAAAPPLLPVLRN